jgi:hypothetical protein
MCSWKRKLVSVERLYCKRPIQCLASSKILTPIPSPPGECVPPPPPRLWCEGGHTRWVETGWGVNILEDARHSSVLYICQYFVLVSETSLSSAQRELKDTERKPFGLHFLGVTSSAVQTLTQVKAWTGIMAIFVCSCC